jgi:two-component system response regulator FlrC
LRVHLRARDEAIGLAFWSKRPGAYSVADVLTARRIADHVALAVSHEQLAELARQRAAALVRAERFDAPVAPVARPDEARRLARIVGRSDRWKAAEKRALQVAGTDATVLLMGESGTGKEMMARFIHRSSPRQRGPFVAINCAALPEQLFESELFGYERGAFTGASAAKPGHIELASGGVLFLDEVTEMSPQAQSKFLRVLQEREFQRLGGTRLLKADMRVIAAANRDLRAAVERGTLRQDLYYRLHVFEIRLPPLRERPSDILPLSEVFLEDIAPALRRPVSRLSRDAIRTLLAHPWPGNVRELRNALERAAILADGGLIASEHLGLPTPSRASVDHRRTTVDDRPPTLDDRPPTVDGRPTTADYPSPSAHSTDPTHPPDTTDLNTLEHHAIAQVLHEVNGNKSEAARRLGLSRTQLYVRLRKHGLGGPESGTADGEVTERSYNVE